MERIAPSVANIPQSRGPGIPDPERAEGLPPSPRRSPRAQAKPGPSRAVREPSETPPRPGRARKERTASFAGKNSLRQPDAGPDPAKPRSRRGNRKPRLRRTALARAPPAPAPAAAAPPGQRALERRGAPGVAGRASGESPVGRPPQPSVRASTPSTQRPRETVWFPLARLPHSPIAAGARLRARLRAR